MAKTITLPCEIGDNAFLIQKMYRRNPATGEFDYIGNKINSQNVKEFRIDRDGIRIVCGFESFSVEEIGKHVFFSLEEAKDKFLPCNIGDTLYSVMNPDGEDISSFVPDSEDWIKRLVPCIGETVFFTEQEAKKAWDKIFVEDKECYEM